MSLFKSYFLKNSDVESTGPVAKPRGFLREQEASINARVPVVNIGSLIITPELQNEIIEECAPELMYLEQTSECVFCKTTYSKKNNVGFLHCRWHPNTGISEDIYDCCQRKKGTPGCAPCDHSPKYPQNELRWTESTDTEIFPLAVAIHLRIPRDNYTTEAGSTFKNTKAIIKRCKW